MNSGNVGKRLWKQILTCINVTAFFPSDSSSSETIAFPCSLRYVLIASHIALNPSVTRLNSLYMQPRSKERIMHEIHILGLVWQYMLQRIPRELTELKINIQICRSQVVLLWIRFWLKTSKD